MCVARVPNKKIPKTVPNYLPGAKSGIFVLCSSTEEAIDMQAKKWSSRSTWIVFYVLFWTDLEAKTLPPINHVFLIVLENKSFSETFTHSPQDPFLRRTLPSKGVLLTRYYGTGHFSLDNYIAMISGQAASAATEADCEQFSDFALKKMDRDGQAVGAGCVYPAQVQTLADQLDATGLTWRAYMEDMGNDTARESSTCGHPALNAKDPTESAEPPREGLAKGDQYTVHHNPFVYFHSIIDRSSVCASHVVRLEALETDLRAIDTTPNFAFITPNLCNDGHDGDGTGAAGKGCVNGEPGGLRSSDRFLEKWVSKILESPAYKRDGLLIVTFDEGDFSAPDTSTDRVTGKTTVTTRAAGQFCCGQRMGPNISRPIVQTDVGPANVTYVAKIRSYGGDLVGAVLLSPYIKAGTVSDVPYNHYSLLRSLEDIFHLNYLGYANQSGLTGFGKDIFGE
jgi:phosphatidylinositol-3-phosphatase